jgi:hypothetical protein
VLLPERLYFKYLVPVEILPVFKGVLPYKLPVNIAVEAINEIYLLKFS